MTKNKNATFDQLIADAEPVQQTITVGGKHQILIQELNGADRFALAERAEDNRWDLLCWVCMQGMIEPKPNKVSYLEKLKPEWVVTIATAITDLSGISEDSIAEAGEESADGTDTGGS